MPGLKQAAMSAVLLLAGCQTYVDGQGRTHIATGPILAHAAESPSGPGEAYVPDGAVRAGVHAFDDFYRRDGLTTVRSVANDCRNSASRGINGEAMSRCFAMDVAAFMVTVSHDRVRHSAPAPDMDIASFRRRFALYQQALGVPPALRQQVEDSVFQRVGAVLGASPS